jgi:hypothetical protein
MPAIIARSISILSDAGLGMAMFSLGVHISEQYYIAQYFCRSIMYICKHLPVTIFRLVHGIAAADHCLWEQTRCIRYGCPVPRGSSSHGWRLHGCRIAWSPSAHCNCSGILQSCVSKLHALQHWENKSATLNCHSIFRLLYLKESCRLCLPRSTMFILTF